MDSSTQSINVFHWITADGLRIFAKDWHVENAKAVVLIVHGLGEHCERYEPMASFFNNQEIGFVGYDRRGHGHSEGKRGHTIHYQALLDEVEELVKKAQKIYQDTPIFLYGHSMGGNIALNFVIQRKPKITGLIVTGAWIELYKTPPSLLIAFAKIINKIIPTFTQRNGLDPSNISTVPLEVEKYKNDPLVHGYITTNTALEMIKAANFLDSFDGEMPVPTLMMHGEEDKIISPNGSRRFSKRAKGSVKYKEWPGLFHEIHNEANRLEVFEFTLNWVIKYLER